MKLSVYEIEALTAMIESERLTTQEIAQYIEFLKQRQKKSEKKEEFIDELEDIFIEHFNEDKMSVKDAAIACFLAFEKSVPSDTSTADIKRYLKKIENIIELFSFNNIVLYEIYGG